MTPPVPFPNHAHWCRFQVQPEGRMCDCGAYEREWRAIQQQRTVEHRFGDYTPTGPGFGIAPRGPQPRSATRHAAWSIGIAVLIIVLFIVYSVAKYA